MQAHPGCIASQKPHACRQCDVNSGCQATLADAASRRRSFCRSSPGSEKIISAARLREEGVSADPVLALKKIISLQPGFEKKKFQPIRSWL
jgi:hypothetical protein